MKAKGRQKGLREGKKGTEQRQEVIKRKTKERQKTDKMKDERQTEQEVGDVALNLASTNQT